MSEKQNCVARDFSQYDQMDTKDLEEILRQDAQASGEQESDTEKILYIAGVLAGRENKNNTGNHAQIAWESFEQNYLPIEDDTEDTEDLPTRKTVRPWIRRLSTIAAVFVLLIGLSATVVGAFGWNQVWSAVAKWAKETFSFVSSSDAEVTEPSKKLQQEYTSLREALDAIGEHNISVPTWIPDGYALEAITIDENPMQSVYVAIYTNSEKSIWITVRSHLDGDPVSTEISEDIVEIYTVSDLKYYIFTNNQQHCVTWSEDSYECLISGDLTVEEIKTMINSIGKG